jgi:hypothetical protein
MLVRFKSDVGGFTMFGDIAVKLLRMTGHSGTVPGAIPAADIPAALERLEKAMAVHPSEPPAQPGAEESADKPPPVSLRQRAFPMLELLRNAAREECGIMWDQP